jgi:hypothetical protein
MLVQMHFILVEIKTLKFNCQSQILLSVGLQKTVVFLEW